METVQCTECQEPVALDGRTEEVARKLHFFENHSKFSSKHASKPVAAQVNWATQIDWAKTIARMFNYRLVMSSLLAAFGATVILSLIWEPLGYLGFLVFPAALFAFALGSSELVCPQCRKNIKVGATACHHCTWKSV